jgi:polyisoprenoid-binding protein YceI
MLVAAATLAAVGPLAVFGPPCPAGSRGAVGPPCRDGPLGVVRAEGADTVRYRIQPETSALTFKATSRLMDADGKFHRFSGEVTADPTDPTTARVTLSVDAASIDTGIARRDRHLRSDDFFHVERFPTITFESLRVEPAGQRFNVVGRLSVHGITREVTVPLDVELTSAALTARGEFVIKRTDYGIDYQSLLNPIGDVVRVAFLFRGRAALQ